MSLSRRGVAIEVLIASALLIACILPIYTLIGSSQHNAFLDEFQVLARRRALQALSVLAGHPPARLLAAATGGSPATEIQDPLITSKAREVYLPLPEGGLDITLENIPKEAQDYYLSRVARVPVRAFIEEIEPGLIRISVLVSWVDPVSQSGRNLIVTRLIEGAFPWVKP